MMHEQSEDQTKKADRNQKNKRDKNNPLWVLGSAALFILAKGKWVLSLLKFGKFGGALVSMLIFIGTYAMMFPFSFAIGLVVMLFIHEMGHLIAAKRKGLPVSAPLFIPFVGALVAMKRHPQDAVTEAYIGYGGPLLGTIGATGAFILSMMVDYPVLYTIAYIGFFLNLINLLPVHPLDGGRISVAVTRWLWLIGLIIAVPVIIYLQSFLLGIIWVMSAWSMYKKYVRNRHKPGIAQVATDFYVHEQRFYVNGQVIPGEDHQRELSFTTYSDLSGQHEGRQVVRASWEVIEFQEEMVMPEQAIIRRVYAKAKQGAQADPSAVRLTVVIEYEDHENDQYYEVPTATRWKYGFAYFGLAVYLIIMMKLVQIEIQKLPPLIS